MTEPEKEMGQRLALDELFDLALYERLRDLETGEVQKVLAKLVTVEKGHVSFWADFSGLKKLSLNFSRRLKLSFFIMLRKAFGSGMTFLILEAIEIYGVKKYWKLWERYQHTAHGEKIRGVLKDEFGHEDEIVAALTGRRLNAERIRDIFLGLNDGLVEILGSVAGFYASFGKPTYVLVASLTVAVAGSISMAAGVLASSGSQLEVERIQNAKRSFFDPSAEVPPETRPGVASVLVGASYLIGAMFPVLPVMLGASNPLWSIVVGALMTMGVSCILSLLSGMDVSRRVLQNLLLVFGAVAVTYALGTLVKHIWEIDV